MPRTHDAPADASPPPPSASLPQLSVRAGLGGFLMGLANLVPGISGGTMLVASGIYPQFVQAIADATRLRFTRQSLLVLGVVVLAAVVGIVALAGLLGQLVVEQTWIMYSLFIGLTLGGVPIIWSMAPNRGGAFWGGAAVGFAAMVVLAVVQMLGVGEGGGEGASFVWMLLSGMAAAAAMILPGVSGGYLLLVLGVYVTILDAVDQARQAVQAGAWEALREPMAGVVLPVGLGVAAGVVVIANGLKVVLERFPRATLGVLLGLLLGAVVGLWPFQQGIPPEAGEVLKGQTVVLVDGALRFEQTGRPVEPKDYPRQFFTPGAGQVGGALGLIVVGFAVTAAVAWFGREKRTPADVRQTPTD